MPLRPPHPLPVPGRRRRWGGWGRGPRPCPSGTCDGRRGRVRRVRSSAPAQGVGWPVSGGARSCGRDPPSACSAALRRFCWRWVPSVGPPADVRFLPLPSSVRVPCSCAADGGADGADWSSLSFSSWFSSSLRRRSQPCMPRATETRSACGSLRLPGRVTYDPRPAGAPVALGWPACPYWQLQNFCRSNTSCCSDKRVILARWGGLLSSRIVPSCAGPVILWPTLDKCDAIHTHIAFDP